MITRENNVEFVLNFHITRNEFRLYELTNTILDKQKRDHNAKTTSILYSSLLGWIDIDWCWHLHNL